MKCECVQFYSESRVWPYRCEELADPRCQICDGTGTAPHDYHTCQCRDCRSQAHAAANCMDEGERE